jgi:hypothetical protein
MNPTTRQYCMRVEKIISKTPYFSECYLRKRVEFHRLAFIDIYKKHLASIRANR